MTLTLILAAGAAFAAWAVLSLLGGERQRQLQDLQAELHTAVAAKADAESARRPAALPAPNARPARPS